MSKLKEYLVTLYYSKTSTVIASSKKKAIEIAHMQGEGDFEAELDMDTASIIKEVGKTVEGLPLTVDIIVDDMDVNTEELLEDSPRQGELISLHLFKTYKAVPKDFNYLVRTTFDRTPYMVSVKDIIWEKGETS